MSDATEYLRDLDGTGSMHPCSKGDPGAVEYVPADTHASIIAKADALAKAVRARSSLANLEEVDAALTDYTQARGEK